MKFMVIYTWEPEKRDEVFKRVQTLGIEPTEGLGLIGQWAEFNGRVFRLIETDDPKAMVAHSLAWNDIGNFEYVPVMELQEAIKLIPGK